VGANTTNNLEKTNMSVVGQVVYTPLITIVVVIISGLAVALMLSKRSQNGLLNIGNGSVDRLVTVSTASSSGIVQLDTTYVNQVVYISIDKANLAQSTQIKLFNAASVADGSAITIFNSPASHWPGSLIINVAAAADSDPRNDYNVNITLGTGQGVSLVTQRRQGSHYVQQLGGITLLPPDLTPDFLQPRDWVVFQYYEPQSNMCSSFNDVPATMAGAGGASFQVLSLSTRNASLIDSDPNGPCADSGTNTGATLRSNGMACTSRICNCFRPTLVLGSVSTVVYPGPSSSFCNVPFSCPANFYNIDNGTTNNSCVACPSGFASLPGSSECYSTS